MAMLLHTSHFRERASHSAQEGLIALLLVSLLSLIASSDRAMADEDKTPEWRVEVEIELGEDRGQNFGTLFEITDAEGRAIAGAGFPGAYNTYARHERNRLHFFVRAQDEAVAFEALARATTDTGVYLYDVGDSLLAKSPSGPSGGFVMWDDQLQQWNPSPDLRGDAMLVAGKPLLLQDGNIHYNGRSILLPLPSSGTITTFYYAQGHLLLHLRTSTKEDAANRLVAVPWSPAELSGQRDIASSIPLELGSDREFLYACGQLGDVALMTTNMGGVYAFQNSAWRTLVEPDAATSYQMYAMINYYDEALLAHYPTGQLFAFDGHKLTRRDQWPPVMEGVSRSSREAQSLAIYGGNLYVGVWPWAELWRYGPAAEGPAEWTFIRCMFTHPERSDTITHPYDEETKATGEVFNIWGQRVTTLLPWKDSLYISTSSKGGQAHDARFPFLSGDRLAEYGRVYRMNHPGHQSAYLPWQSEPQKLTFTWSRQRLLVERDGEQLTEFQLDGSETASPLAASRPARMVWGAGIYGRFSGRQRHQVACGTGLESSP